MPRKAVKARIAWSDRFAKPATSDVLAPFPKHTGALIARVREGLINLEGVAERLEWLGVPWRWTLVYVHKADPGRPFAYIVPQPGKPLFALPLSTDAVPTLPLRKLSKTCRDTLLTATQVGGVHWPQWELGSKSLADELVMLATLRHEMLLAATA